MTTSDASEIVVRDNPQGARFEIYVGAELAGFTQYQRQPAQISFIHTETGAQFAGQGLASRLVRAALQDVRERGLAVLPFCPYVRKFIATHPDFQDLVPADRRAEFGF